MKSNMYFPFSQSFGLRLRKFSLPNGTCFFPVVEELQFDLSISLCKPCVMWMMRVCPQRFGKAENIALMESTIPFQTGGMKKVEYPRGDLFVLEDFQWNIYCPFYLSFQPVGLEDVAK